jgi:1-deoxy-D-xylulose-5-phosphate reductoisomerase
MSNKKGVAILGSTGSVGVAAFEVIASFPDQFELEVLTASSNADLLIEQALKSRPNTVVISDVSQYKKVNDALWKEDIHVYTGKEAICQVLESQHINLVFNAIIGIAGIAPTIASIHANKHIALANKDSLVVCGEYVTSLAEQKGVNIYPVDPSHSSVFQCLVGEFHNKIDKLYLTTNGGPFYNQTTTQLNTLLKEKSFKKGDYAPKQYVDLSSMIYAGFKVVEAKWLFNLKPEQIEIFIHESAVINGLIAFEDGSVKAQMEDTNLKRSVQFALTYPQRFSTNLSKLNLLEQSNLSFERPDKIKFPNLNHALEALKKGGSFCAALSASNSAAAEAFLQGKIKFSEIAVINESVINSHKSNINRSVEDYLLAYDLAYENVSKMIK